MGVAVIYLGDVSPCNVKVNDKFYTDWKTNETKIICADAALKLTKDNKDFVLVGSNKLEERQVSEEIPIENTNDKEVMKEDVNKMSKDQLLDLSVQLGLTADYTMTKSELKKLINSHYNKY